MKWSRLGDLIATGHVLFGRGQRRKWKPRAPVPLVRVSREEYHSLFRLTTIFLSKDNQYRPTDRDLGVHCILVVALAVYHPCWLGCAHACVTPLCSLGMLNTSFARHSCFPISPPLLLAAGSVSILRLRYSPNQPS
jgi:hypothetical protein